MFDPDCHSSLNIASLFNSILDNSINTPICNSYHRGGVTSSSTFDGRRCSSPATYPMKGFQQRQRRVSEDESSSSSSAAAAAVTSSLSSKKPPRRTSTSSSTSSFRSRKSVGLAVTSSATSNPPHLEEENLPHYYSPPPRISCSRNVELRRKSLSERHFFRPVSEDEESSRGGMRK
ncbi:hypothetical protein ACHAWU_003534 [Discostella pseudostelligera]|uniref:Uncharacterized protein n=1 Tax=Discostella pseudostelligera TaxID=259834 RepID=A0ABD3LYF4_9STRA